MIHEQVSAPTGKVVTYDGLPIASGGAHSLRLKQPVVAYERVRQFLDACTTSTGVTPWTFTVTADSPAAVGERLLGLAADRLHKARRTPYGDSEWTVKPQSITEVLEWLAAIGPSATTKYRAPVATLTQSLRVRVLDHQSGTPWPDLAPEMFGGFAVDGYGRLLGMSGVRATFGNSSSSLSLWLNLPADGRLVPAARHLQEHLPVKFSMQHWRLWRKSPSGDSYRSSKIPSPLAPN